MSALLAGASSSGETTSSVSPALAFFSTSAITLSRNVSRNLSGWNSVVSSSTSCSAIASSLSPSLLALTPSAGSFSPSSERMSSLQRSRLSTSTGPRGDEGSEVLARLDDDPRQADAPGLEQRLAQQRVDLLALGHGGEVVRPVEEDERDVLQGNEGLDLDRLRRARIDRVDLVLAEDDVLAGFPGDALDDVVLVDLLAGALVDALVADGIHAALVEPVEVEPAAARRRVQADRDVDEPEADGAVPQSAGRCGHADLVVEAGDSKSYKLACDDCDRKPSRSTVGNDLRSPSPVPARPIGDGIIGLVTQQEQACQATPTTRRPPG